MREAKEDEDFLFVGVVVEEGVLDVAFVEVKFPTLKVPTLLGDGFGGDSLR